MFILYCFITDTNNRKGIKYLGEENMKKILGILILASMVIAVVPTSIGGMSGSIEYNSDGSGNTVPIKILAIWETNGDSSLDDDYFSPGCQIDPPLTYESYTDVWVYVAVLDLNEPLEITDTDQVKIDISWPANDIADRPDLGDGSECVDNLEPVYFATWQEYLAADTIDSGANNPFICYYNQANDEEGLDGYDYLEWMYFESNVIIFRAKHDLYYHDPAGWYDVEVTIQASTIDTQLNYFEYVYAISVDPDFTYVDWGPEYQLNTWFAKDGNWIWDENEEEPYPTIVNVGNWDTHLGCHFTSGDFQQDKVLFDVRAGDSNPESQKYNPTYCEENGIDGMVPCNWNYYPIPIDNDFWLGPDTNYDDVLLKCHLMKLDFYIRIIEWNKGPGVYNFDIDLFTWDPPWQPAPGFPCPQEPEEADIGIEKTVNNSQPEIGSIVEFTITVTNFGPDDATNIMVDDLLPDGLLYVSDVASQGVYDYITGEWDVGSLADGASETLTIEAIVVPIGSYDEFVQMALLLDGSGSIVFNDWLVMLDGLAYAIENCFPLDESVELTVIQFGGVEPPLAQIEIAPIIVNNTNYVDIVNDLYNIDKLNGSTPTACAINLAADTLFDSENFDESNRHVINLVTDGVPNCVCETGEYTGISGSVSEGKESAENATAYLIELLGMTSDQDEFDAEAVGSGADVNWLKESIVWPGNYEWTGVFPPGPGWVRQVSDFAEFADTICEKFAILFGSIENCATITGSDPMDPNTSNDFDCLEIIPQLG